MTELAERPLAERLAVLTASPSFLALQRTLAELAEVERQLALIPAELRHAKPGRGLRAGLWLRARLGLD